MRDCKSDSLLQSASPLTLLTGCNSRLPGQPTEAERWRAPAEITDFNQLYTQNCAGCHGVRRKNLARRVRLTTRSIWPLSRTTQCARRSQQAGLGRICPRFSEQAGGHLTDQQIELIVNGMRAHWSKPDDFKGVDLPRYSVNETATPSGPSEAVNNNISAQTSQTGDAARGSQLTRPICASCHGTNGEGGSGRLDR